MVEGGEGRGRGVTGGKGKGERGKGNGERRNIYREDAQRERGGYNIASDGGKARI